MLSLDLRPVVHLDMHHRQQAGRGQQVTLDPTALRFLLCSQETIMQPPQASPLFLFSFSFCVVCAART
jgi:hypothetical protein